MASSGKSKLVFLLIIASLLNGQLLAEAKEKEPVFELVRSGGGACPAYKVRIFEDGLVEFERTHLIWQKSQSPNEPNTASLHDSTRGLKNPPPKIQIEAHKSQIPSSTILNLKQEFRSANFFAIRARKYTADGRAILDCKLDAEIIQKFPGLSVQCKTNDEVVHGLGPRNDGDEMYFRDGDRSARYDSLRTVGYGAKIRHLSSRIDQVVNSEQWTGRNQCAVSPVSKD